MYTQCHCNEFSGSNLLSFGQNWIVILGLSSLTIKVNISSLPKEELELIATIANLLPKCHDVVTVRDSIVVRWGYLFCPPHAQWGLETGPKTLSCSGNLLTGSVQRMLWCFEDLS